MTDNEWLDDETAVPEAEVNDEAPAEETAAEYGQDEEYPGVEAPPEPEQGQNDGQEVKA
jgi:hypothetical protein